MAFTRLRRYSVRNRENLIKYAREQLFGYESGMPGEKEFIKPLKGRETVNWYWPSKYLLADFNLSHYLYYQADRMCRRNPENPLKDVDLLFQKVDENRQVIQNFLTSIKSEAIVECPTLLDLECVLELSKTLQKTNYEDKIVSEDADYSESVKNLASRRRYIDNMYYRRRLSYLQKMKKKTFKHHKSKEHYLIHPDDKIVWPDNKGPVQKKWPTIY